jgi:hypothetical protein
MNIIVGEITYELDGYYVVLLIDNPDQINISILVKTADQQFNVTNVEVLKLPSKVIIRMDPTDRLYYLTSNAGNDSDLVEIPVNLTSKKIYNIYTYSCDFPEMDAKKSIWSTMIQDINSCVGRTLAIGLGDNVYADSAWYKSLMNPDNTLDNYIKRYRKTLFGSDRKSILSGVNSNLFIPDDHEICNDLTVVQARGYDQVVTDNAVNVYYRYLGNVHVAEQKSIDRGWVKYYDDLMIVSFERATRGRPSIDVMINRINELLTAVPDIKSMIIITGWACIPCPPNDNVYGRMYRQTCGISKFMSDDDLYILYNYLLSLSSRLSIVLVGGDLHFGSKFTVTRGLDKFDILVTSPITNQPTSDRKLAAKGLRGQDIMINNITVHNISAKAKRCYGRIMNSHPLVANIFYHSS